jgi:hypothetical protein
MRSEAVAVGCHRLRISVIPFSIAQTTSEPSFE